MNIWASWHEPWSVPPHDLAVRLQRYGAHRIPAGFAADVISLHHCWGIYAVDRPGVTWSYDGRQRCMSHERLTVIPPLMPFRHPWAEGAGHAYLHVAIGGLPAPAARRLLAAPLEIDDPQLFADFSALMRLIHEPGADGRVAGQRALAIAHGCLAQVFAQAQADESNALVAGWGPVADALAYIDRHLGESVALADIAAVLGVSPQHCSRLFKRHLGLSPIRYLLEQRVLKAAMLLVESDRSISEIAGDCGFPSRQYLSRLFVRTMRQTPAAYRRRFAQGL